MAEIQPRPRLLLHKAELGQQPLPLRQYTRRGPESQVAVHTSVLPAITRTIKIFPPTQGYLFKFDGDWDAGEVGPGEPPVSGVRGS